MPLSDIMNNTFDRPVYQGMMSPAENPKGIIDSRKNSTEWTDEEKQKQAIYTALHLVDWAQTRDLTRKMQEPGSTWHEQNPILGENPHQDKVDIYMALSGLAQLYLADKLSTESRKLFQDLSIGIEKGAVGNNFNLGIKAKF